MNTELKTSAHKTQYILQKPKTVHVHAKHTTNMTRTDAWRRVCAAMVPYRRLDYIHWTTFYIDRANVARVSFVNTPVNLYPTSLFKQQKVLFYVT